MKSMKPNMLVEIKKGQTGTGLLIESDGYMDLSLPGNQILKESIESFRNGDVNELPRPFVVSAVFQKYGIKNGNGRIYPEEVLKREVEKYMNLVHARGSIGECNHPNSSDLDVERISMLITELHWEGRTLVGQMEIPITEGFRKFGICSTLADRVAQWLISGIRIGVSSRALGSVEQRGDCLYVGNDLEILAWDVVGTPSTPNAYIEMDSQKLRPYIEEKNEKEGEIINEKKENKFSKFDSWLND